MKLKNIHDFVDVYNSSKEKSEIEQKKKLEKIKFERETMEREEYINIRRLTLNRIKSKISQN